jgi:putative ABC transport system permease protein
MFDLGPGIRRLFRLPLRTTAAIHADVDDELESLIASRVEYLMARGMSPADARAEALQRLGVSLDDARHQLHESAEHREHRMRIRDQLENVVQDLRYAARGLVRRPAFTAVAVSTLAIGIGATTAIFSAVNVLLLRPLPFANPGELMSVTLVSPDNGPRKGTDRMVWSYPKFVAFRDAQTVFSSLAVYSGMQVSLTSGEVELIRGEFVGATYLRTLGLSPARGRDFDPSLDAAPGAARQAIVSYSLWQRRFNLDPTVIGKTIDINHDPYVVVGVTPDGFKGSTGQAEVFLPVTTRSADDLGEAQSHEFSLVARRKPGVGIDRAANEVAILGQRVNEGFPDKLFGNLRWGAAARPLDAGRVSPVVRRSILILFGAVAFVLLIACVNVANLLLGRAGARRREIAVRLALGAGRRRLVRLMLTESVLLAAIGGVASVFVAWLGTRALSSVNPAALRLQRGGAALGVVTFSSISLDWVAIGFTFGVALLVGVLFGLAPALHATRASLSSALKEGGSAATGARRRGAPAARRLLVVAEVALALVLLAGSGLMIRSLTKLLASDPGFDAQHLLTVRLTIPSGGLSRDSLPGFYTQLLDRLRALPGVTHAAVGDCAPLSGGCNGTLLELMDRPKVDFAHKPSVGVFWATPDLFATLRVPLKRGRLFTATDRVGMPKVVVINETAARRYWPNDDPIGKRIGVGQGGFSDGAEVIGVVGDVRQWADSLARPDVYLPYYQSPNSRMMIFLRTAGDPTTLGPAVRAAIRELAPRYPVYDMQSMTERAAAATAQARFSAALLGLFALTALSLAGIGIYGVMSIAVTTRTREIGIRIALGADRSRVQGLVVGEGIALVSLGVVIGVGGALVATRVLRSLLFDLTPSDPITYVTIVAVLGAAAIVASWIPARRASRVDPVVALRAE